MKRLGLAELTLAAIAVEVGVTAGALVKRLGRGGVCFSA